MVRQNVESKSVGPSARVSPWFGLESQGQPKYQWIIVTFSCGKLLRSKTYRYTTALSECS